MTLDLVRLLIRCSLTSWGRSVGCEVANTFLRLCVLQPWNGRVSFNSDDLNTRLMKSLSRRRIHNARGSFEQGLRAV